MVSFRYSEALNLRNGLIHLCAKIQGKNLYLIRSNYEDSLALLKHSHVKGTFIERMVTTPAWDPILSVEALDGQDWKTAQGHFRRVLVESEWKKRLPKIVQTSCQNLKKTAEIQKKPINNLDMRRLVCEIMYSLVFKNSPPEDHINLLCKASIEWSKELAMKGSADKHVKLEFMSTMTTLIEQKNLLPQIELSPYQKQLYVSAISQPLFISPMINFSDVFSAVGEQWRSDTHWYEQLRQAKHENNRTFIHQFVLECVRLRHPFPVLERELTKDIVISTGMVPKGSHVIILVDEFKQDPKFLPARWDDPDTALKSFIFGAGPRGCLGQQLAEYLFTEVVWELIDLDLKINTWDKATSFSGRNNDHIPIAGEVKHQLKSAVRLLFTSYQLRKI